MQSMVAAGILQSYLLIQVSVVAWTLIASTDQCRLIDAHLSSMNYDANKLPLGISHPLMGVRLFTVLQANSQSQRFSMGLQHWRYAHHHEIFVWNINLTISETRGSGRASGWWHGEVSRWLPNCLWNAYFGILFVCQVEILLSIALMWVFGSIIPHVFGRMRPTVIRDQDLLKRVIHWASSQLSYLHLHRNWISWTL